MNRVLILLILVTVPAFADTSSPIPVVDSITAWLSQTHVWVPMLGGLVSELVMRFFPTKNPLSWFHLIAAGARQIATLLSGLATFLDSIFPQNISS